MENQTNAKIRVRLESFNAELLTSSCRKIVDTVQNNEINRLSVVPLPTPAIQKMSFLCSSSSLFLSQFIA